jgi:hypothetical protein
MAMLFGGEGVGAVPCPVEGFWNWDGRRRKQGICDAGNATGVSDSEGSRRSQGGGMASGSGPTESEGMGW